MTADYDALVQRIIALCDEWDAAIEPDGSTSLAPVQAMAAELRARVLPPGQETP